MRLLYAARTRLRLLLARRAAEVRMDEEFRFHLEMEAERLVREAGLDPQEARRQARLAFGYVERYKEELRDGRGPALPAGLALDLKLGFRMLVKYPGLTIVGGLAMAFAIWVGAVTFQLVSLFVSPTLPLPGGDRVVQLRNWDMAASAPETRALHDFIVWREALRSVTDLGAFQDVPRNLIADDGEARLVQVAEITASAFRIAPTPPLLGRALVTADERAGAPPVLVLGYDVWRTRFGGDSAVVGRSVRLGDAYATVVGVMPEGFAFPIAHELWTPLRPDLLDRAPRAGPAITVFGRLAPGATLAAAQAEVTTLGRRAAAEYPDTHERLVPQVAPFAKLFFGPTNADLAMSVSINVFVVMLLVLVCGNVALLLFARAAMRQGELVVRSALGASRGRITMQLFAEALVLGGVAAAVGLAAADVSLRRWGMAFLETNLGRMPFWFDVTLSPATVLYAVVLTIVGAAIAGVLPALKVTRGLGSRLRQGTAGGGGMQFGGVWTAVIIAQVAVTVAFPAIVYLEQRELLRIRSLDPGFAAEEYLAVQLDVDAPTRPGVDERAAREAQGAKFGAALEALRGRVAAEPGVRGVTFVDQLPRDHQWTSRIELDEPSAPSARAAPEASPARLPGRVVSTAGIDPTYFDVLAAPILAGRGFQVSDVAPDARAVIVDQGFVDQVLLGRNPIGQRVRFAADAPSDGSSVEAPNPWLEIVGVVQDLGMGSVTSAGRPAGLYLPVPLSRTGRIHMVVRAQGDPMSLAPRIRALAAAVDPTLRVSSPQRLDEVTNGALWVVGLWLRITVVLTAIALLLSLAGIYAVLSFTVARRTREIGVRVALGASRRSVVSTIFRRPLTQVSLGVVAGGGLIVLGALALSGALGLSGDGAMSGNSVFSVGALTAGRVALIVAYAALMLGVCLLACIVPTRRALAVEPTEAFRVQ
jgi:putative ABC transport system permease protein